VAIAPDPRRLVEADFKHQLRPRPHQEAVKIMRLQACLSIEMPHSLPDVPLWRRQHSSDNEFLYRRGRAAEEVVPHECHSGCAD